MPGTAMCSFAISGRFRGNPRGRENIHQILATFDDPEYIPFVIAPSKSNQFLAKACEVLGLVDGCLLPASEMPIRENEAHWTDKGDWLQLADSLGVESIFFVENEPVLILANLPDGTDEAEFFNRIWNMARPQVLFLAREGELVVCKLAAPPVGSGETLRAEERMLALAESIAEIQEKLADFRRENIESGSLFGDGRFATGAYRADRALVHDLKILRQILTTGPDSLSIEVAHALIGRTLFIRYLEDRAILGRKYFEDIASRNKAWSQLLDDESGPVFSESRFAGVCFFRLLQNHGFTYAFFDQLADDFNGDTFPVSRKERKEVKACHLKRLRDMLTGTIRDQDHGQLFLFAYRFEFIPIEIISSIYEDFYTARQGRGQTQSSFYTPPALVDFLLTRVLTRKLLDQRPRVTDPSCGSGIFLVEAFRRMVRHRVATQGRRLSPQQLRVILRDQIRGIDLNPEAVPVAAFSLYLAYLHYQTPREINEKRRLPNLRWMPEREDYDPNQHLDILFAGNAFEAIQHSDAVVRKRFGPASADLVVGNPPWGEVKKTDILGRQALPVTKAWWEATPERSVGDNELSQAFVHLALELLADGGKAALLLSSGVLFKQHDKSKAFRQSWLRRSKFEHVVNFAHVRHIFFSDPARPGQKGLRESDGTSPFISAIFEKGVPPRDHRFTYWSARRTVEVENTRSIVVSHSDMHRLRQDDCRRYENLWKIYWWGSRRDEGLIREMERHPSLATLPAHISSVEVTARRGFQEGNKSNDADWLAEYEELQVQFFVRYGLMDASALVQVPKRVERRGVRSVFDGHRILIRQGIGADGIVARLETSSFCFRNSIFGFLVQGLSRHQEQAILGILWSSLGRYYYWLTAGSWGMWHDQLHLHYAGKLPIAFPSEAKLRDRIVRIVTALQTVAPPIDGPMAGLESTAWKSNAARAARIARLEEELDEAIFDLYELNEADRDLVRDMCRYGMDFFYKRSESIAVQPVARPTIGHGLLEDLPTMRTDGLPGYLQVFLQHWNADLAPEGELAWEVIAGPGDSPVLAVLFSSTTKGCRPASVQKANPDAWQEVLARINANRLLPAGTSGAIYTDTFVRAVSEHEIIIVKRNEARHWTRSMAREDADATIAQAMNLADLKE